MDNNQTEVDKFFQDLPAQDKQVADIFADPTAEPKDEPAKAEETKEEPEVKEDEEGDLSQEARKNRRHRRLEEALQRERESNIALNERIKTLAEVSKVQSDGEVPAEWIALLGDSPEAKKAWLLQQSLLNQSVERARETLKEELQAEQRAQEEELQKYESEIDSNLETIEEKYGVDLTSNSPKAKRERNEFLNLVEKLSPKDEDGGIREFADFDSTFELYHQSKVREKSPVTEKQKELASRSMQSSSQGGSQPTKSTPGFFGWKKDYNL